MPDQQKEQKDQAEQKASKPILLLNDIERAKPHPYEMLSFGQWVGHRFKWNRDLRLEIFPKTPYSIYKYANDCILRSYPEMQAEDGAITYQKNTYTKMGVFFIIYKGNLLGYYEIKNNATSKFCCAFVQSIAGKMTQGIVLAVLTEIQNIAKHSGMEMIFVDWDLPAYAVPPGISTVAVDQSVILNNLSAYYSVETIIPRGAALDLFNNFSKTEQDRLQSDYVKLSTVIGLNPSITFAIRDEKDKFIGLAVLSVEPNITNIFNLKYLFVDPAFRGEGLGHKLLKLVEVCLRNANVNNIVLQTDEFMVPNFYLKRGYTRVLVNNTFEKRLPNADGTPGAPPRLANPLRLV